MFNSKQATGWFMLGMVLLMAPWCLSAQDQPVGLISLQANASLEVETDTMTALVAIEDEHTNPDTLAASINKTMKWAQSLIHKQPDITVIGGNYNTYPVYDKRIFKHWRGSQQITLKSKNSVALGKLIGQLQERLLIKSLDYQVSEARLAEVQDQLMKHAIDAFKARAEIARKQLGASAYSIYRLDINTQTQGGPAYPRQRLMVADAMESRSSVPATLTPGQQTVQVHANGSIQLIFPE